MASRTEAVPLPSPDVSFGSDFLRRLGILTAKVESQRERQEGAGRFHLTGVGAEFVGFRPYRPGEDLRQLDWSLYARLRRPMIRVARREASERWAVLVDTSASMGVGRPGKLQCAAEVAAAIGAIGLKNGVTVELHCSGTSESYRMRRRPDLAGGMRLLESQKAAGERGLAWSIREEARLRGAGAVFLIGDFLDLEPQAVFELTRRGRELFCIQILAPEELAPEPERTVRWIDAETGASRSLDVDRRACEAYERLLSERLETWGEICKRHHTRYGFWKSTTPFETVASSLF